MTVVVDIECPYCGRTGPVRKERIATYRCDDCGTEFGREEIEP
jgi:DNA-directed RNA polymerase subunit RPC12/RpoP